MLGKDVVFFFVVENVDEVSFCFKICLIVGNDIIVDFVVMVLDVRVIFDDVKLQMQFEIGEFFFVVDDECIVLCWIFRCGLFCDCVFFY